MKKRNLLLGSLAMLVVAVIAFTGATYAWFISGREPSVQQIDIGVADASVVQLGAKKPTANPTGKDYFFQLPFATLSGIGADGYYANPNTITTTPSNPNKRNLDAATPEADDDEIVFNATTGEVKFAGMNSALGNQADYDSTMFIAFDLYFINLHTSKNARVAVDAKASKIFCNETPGFYGKDSNNNDIVLSDAQKQVPLSTRVAFITYDQEPKTVDGGGGGTSESDIKVWDNFASQSVSSHGLLPGTAGDETDHAGVQEIIKYTNSLYTPKVEEDYVGYQGGEDKLINLFDLEPFNTVADAADAWKYSTRLTVYIWIEGNDTDCVTAVAGGFFSVSLQFATDLYTK